MKKLILSFVLLSSIFLTTTAQYGGNAVGLSAVEYIEIPVNPNGSLDIAEGFTFEAWILNFAGTSNQKVGGKLVNDFKNGFIYGIEDLRVNFEVFDNNGTNTSLKAGSVSGIGWTHVAGSYEVGGMLTIYINGQKAGETAASGIAINPNTNPFRIGIAPWDVNALGFVGYIDEARYWQAALDEETIRAWMHRDVTSDHPDYNALGFYHKYNEMEGPAVMDETDNENFGIFSDEEIVLEQQFLPFKGEFTLFDNDVQGIWNAKSEASSDILSISGTFFDTLALEQSVLLSHSDGDYSFDTDAPGDYDRSLSKIWRIATQGELFSAVSFDLGPIDMGNVMEVVLLAGTDEDLSDAEVITGELDGSTFAIEELIFNDGWYYTLGFKTTTSTSEAGTGAYQIEMAPNPSRGSFLLKVEQQQPAPFTIHVLDKTGRRLFLRSVEPTSLEFLETMELPHLPPGMYLLELSGDNLRSTRKLVIY